MGGMDWVIDFLRNTFLARGARGLAVCLLAMAAAGGAKAESEDPAGWIRQLGAAKHADRESAAAALWQIGEPALDALREAAKSPDPEVAQRARQLVDDIALGVRPSWPEALRQRVRGYETLPADAKKSFLEELAQALGEESAPFLLSRLSKGEAAEANAAADCLLKLLDSERVQALVSARLEKPTNEYEARVLAAACEKKGSSADIAKALGLPHLPTPQRDRLAGQALERLQAVLDAKAFEDLARDAALLAAAVPDEARFLYYQAAGAAHLQRPEEAATLCKKALALNPQNEAPHYQAGELLGKLGQPNLAAAEWQRILEIPPEGDVYDINALFRLGAIHAHQEQFARAADAYERGLQMLRKAKETKGSSMGMVGSSEEELEARIAEYRARAATPDEAKNALAIQLDVVVKGDREKDLKKFWAQGDVTMSMKTQPHGFRLFESAPATVHYDTQRKEFEVLLNGTRIGPGVAGALKDGTTRIVVSDLDMLYLFEIDAGSGAAKKVDALEVDYTLKLEPGPLVKDWGSPGVEIDGKLHPWEELKAGLPFDFLPEKMNLIIKGTAPGGEEKKIQMTLEPAPLKP